MKEKSICVAKAVGRMCMLFGLLSLLTAAGLKPMSAHGGDTSSDGTPPAGLDGDGYADLLSATGNQMWGQGSPGIAGAAEAGDWFGGALTAGDFDGDGYADLAIGVPREEIEGVYIAGAVNVLYGSDSGLSATGNQMWDQDSPGIADAAEGGDWFGSALTAGDFNGDGYADLAVGVPSEGLVGADYAGAVNVLYGSGSGLSATGNQIWHQDSPGIAGAAEDSDCFGGALTAGDFDGDGYADLAIGVPYEEIEGVYTAGAVNVLYGSGSGLSATGNQMWDQDSPGIADAAEAGDWFGRALTAGDFDQDGYADLAIGVPREEIEGANYAGAVNVLYGSGSGLSATGNQMWDQHSPGIAGAAEGGDWFGRALTAGDLNGDGYADLAIGVPYEEIEGVYTAGAVNVLYGSGSGLSATGNQMWDQDSPSIAGAAERGDWFGHALTAGDLNGDGYADLAIGVPSEDLASTDSGAVNVLYGLGGGLSATGNQMWDQDSPGIAGAAEGSDWFGGALTAGDFNGDGYADLAVGVPNEDLAGVVNVLYGSGRSLKRRQSPSWYST